MLRCRLPRGRTQVMCATAMVFVFSISAAVQEYTRLSSVLAEKDGEIAGLRAKVVASGKLSEERGSVVVAVRQICDPASGCNVCSACCHAFIPDGDVCTKCAENSCANMKNLEILSAEGAHTFAHDSVLVHQLFVAILELTVSRLQMRQLIRIYTITGCCLTLPALGSCLPDRIIAADYCC
jgi:hypothetical protein